MTGGVRSSISRDGGNQITTTTLESLYGQKIESQREYKLKKEENKKRKLELKAAELEIEKEKQALEKEKQVDERKDREAQRAFMIAIAQSLASNRSNQF